MKVQIWSKTGELNTILEFHEGHTLWTALKELRKDGYYEIRDRDTVLVVPFEQIKYLSRVESR